MPEFRKDPVSDHWVIIAPNRAAQAGAIRIARPIEDSPALPVLSRPRVGHSRRRGNLRLARLGFRDAEWQVRVVQNKYPALEMVERPLTISSALYEVGPGFGAHEVIVEAPDHIVSFGDLELRQAELAFLAYRDRLLHLRTDPRIAYGQLFKNSGSAAGASLEHTHSQLIGTPIIPTQIQAELSRSRIVLRPARTMCVLRHDPGGTVGRLEGGVRERRVLGVLSICQPVSV